MNPFLTQDSCSLCVLTVPDPHPVHDNTVDRGKLIPRKIVMAQFSVHPWDQELVLSVTITSLAEIGDRRRMENFTCCRCCYEQEGPSWKRGLPAETRYPLPFCICIWNSATPASFSMKKGKVDSSSRKLWCECKTDCRSCSCSSWTGSSLVTAILRRNSNSRDSDHDKDHFYRWFFTVFLQ